MCHQRHQDTQRFTNSHSCVHCTKRPHSLSRPGEIWPRALLTFSQTVTQSLQFLAFWSRSTQLYWNALCENADKAGVSTNVKEISLGSRTGYEDSSWHKSHGYSSEPGDKSPHCFKNQVNMMLDQCTYRSSSFPVTLLWVRSWSSSVLIVCVIMITVLVFWVFWADHGKMN